MPSKELLLRQLVLVALLHLDVSEVATAFELPFPLFKGKPGEGAQQPAQGACSS